MSYMILGVHGLANKPPKTQHAPEWVAAINEGLERNCSLSQHSVNFDLVFWAHSNYDPLLNADPEPYIRTPDNQPIQK